MYTRYEGSFISREGHTYKVAILSEDSSSEIEELSFDAANAVTIEWGSVDKHEVICSSTATLRLFSDEDRQFIDLYTEKVGEIRCDIYRDEQLYWSGCLDAEFYEEPYERLNGYIVSLTFSDFGVLDRLTYNREGLQTIQAILDDAFERCNLNYTAINQDYISTHLSGESAPLTLSDIQVNSDNFYDEEDEASTLEEVIEGVFQPLGLRLTQRGGCIYIYDLNGLYNASESESIYWTADAQTLGVDKVYNNVAINWSTYTASGQLTPDTCWTEDATISDEDAANALNTRDGVDITDDVKVYAYHASYDTDDWSDLSDVGFAMALSRNGDGATLTHDNCQFFHIVPKEDGSESEGVAVYWESVGFYGETLTNTVTRKAHGVRPTFKQYESSAPSTELFRTDEVNLPPVTDASKLRLRIGLNALIDVRFNPFETAENLSGGTDDADYMTAWKKFANFVYVPVKIVYDPQDGGEKVLIWDNRSVLERSYKYPVKTLSATMGEWVSVSATEVDTTDVHGYLCYYDFDDRVDSDGTSGWQYNKPCINTHVKDLTKALQSVTDGCVIPYPQVTNVSTQHVGTIKVIVYGSRWRVSGEKTILSDTVATNQSKAAGHIKWIMFQMPEIEIQNNTQWDYEIDTDDITYEGVLDADAKEDLSISTICGTSADGVPTARGAYYTTKGAQITELTRNDVTTQAEELLIGTLFSQYGSRRTKLSGEARIGSAKLVPFTEDNQPDKLFIATSSVEDLITDTTELEVVEFLPDEYEKAE